MSASAITVAEVRPALLTTARDYVTLTKPRIAVLVLITTAVAAQLASWGQVDPWRLFWTLLGTAAFAASASALNQLMEVPQDGTMRRTKQRPLPAGRLTSAAVVTFAVVTLIAGHLILGLLVNVQAMGWGLATWAVYVLAYTPLKTRSSVNTAVGAVSGALPVLIGWSSTDVALDYRAWAMFGVLFLWQFPHFMAIAWLYRREYDQAGFKMLTTVDATGRRAGVQAVLAAAAVVPVSLIPALGVPTPVAAWYMLIAFALGLAQWALAGRFMLRRDDVSARWLLRASLIYLPSILLLLLLFPWA